ncbi:MAG: HTH domain-containing protein [Bergeyella sp.]
MNIKDRIVKFLEENKESSASEIADELMVSRQSVHSVLKKLLEEKQVIKLGSSPRTIYKINNAKQEKREKIEISDEDDLFLKNNFLVITEIGEILEGTDGFAYWCKKRNLPVEKTVQEYISTREKYNRYSDENGMINGFEKLKNTKGFEKIWIDEIYYFDFYAIERFGKTRLGTILHYAKQGQNVMLMKILVQEIKTRLENFIENNGFDAVGFVPPTIKRETQIMKFLQKKLKINLPHIEILKISNLIPVPQKSLNKLEERVNNAENTFVVKSNQTFENVLLIDDAVGSGATLNQIAGKLKQKNIAKHITALSVVGSFKGFDVITDV